MVALIYHDGVAMENSALLIVEKFAGTAPVVKTSFGEAIAVGVARTALHACFRCVPLS